MENDTLANKLAESQLEAAQCQEVLSLAQTEFESLRSQRDSAEDKYLSLKVHTLHNY